QLTTYYAPGRRRSCQAQSPERTCLYRLLRARIPVSSAPLFGLSTRGRQNSPPVGRAVLLIGQHQEGRKEPPAGNLPDPHSGVGAGGRHGASVGREADPEDPPFMSFEGVARAAVLPEAPLPPALQVPDPDRPPPGADHEEPPVGREGDGPAGR